jgi:argininosuccinate lyase
MDTREECLDHLLRFVQSGDIAQAAVAAGTALAYLATLESTSAQAAAIRRLRADLASLTQEVELSGEAEDRHVAIEDALTKACVTIEGKTPCT